MDYIKTLEYIHSLGKFSHKASLERIKKVLNVLGNPQNDFKTIHVAGTNGKGSVCTMLSSVFCEAGHKTGLYISPYVIDFRERIQINGEYISENDLVFFAKRIIETKVELTEFEFITAIAFLYFSSKKIDILICETGLGGRFDATNAIENKLVSVITKIGLDHTAILGDTIEEIAKEKCGILRDCPTVTSPYQNKRALNVIKSHSKKLIIPDLSQLLNFENSITKNEFEYKKEKYFLSLLGKFQIENAIVAIETIKNSGYTIDYDTIYKGLKKASIPARLELISNNPLVVLDGAHNPDGASVLCDELQKYSGGIVAIIGMMKDKDYNEFLEKVLPYCMSAIAVEVKDMPRSLTATELKEAVSKFCPCEEAQDYSTAIKSAIKIADRKPIFVFGSLYLASQIRPLLKEIFIS